jgi:hypothetical protein
MIVPAQHVELARTIAATLDPAGSQGLFTTPLGPIGSTDITHYVSTGFVAENFALAIPFIKYTMTDMGYEMIDHSPGNPTMIHELCLQYNLTIPIEELISLYSSADITDEEPFAAFARLQLTIIQPDNYL